MQIQNIADEVNFAIQQDFEGAGQRLKVICQDEPVRHAEGAVGLLGDVVTGDLLRQNGAEHGCQQAHNGDGVEIAIQNRKCTATLQSMPVNLKCPVMSPSVSLFFE